MSELLELKFEGVSLDLGVGDLLCLGAILDVGTDVGKTIEVEDLCLPGKLEG